MTKEEAKKFGLQLLHGIMERNESYPVYANNVKQAIDALSEPSGSSEIPKDLEEAAEEYEYNRVFESELENYSIYLDSLEDGEEPKMKEPSKDAQYLLNADVIDAYIAGAKWQKEQMMDEWLKDRDGCFWDGVEEGKKAMREQMMLEAVDAIVEDWNPDPEPEITIPLNPEEFTCGDKVRVIVLPKED